MLSSRRVRDASRTVLVLSSVCLGLALALPAAAQYSGGTSAAQPAGIPSREMMAQRVDEARWHLGPLRLAPWYGLRDASFVSGTDTDTDFTASVGAGLRGYLRGGDRILVAGHFLPEYTWWAEDSARSGVDGRAGVALLGYFNRLTTEVSYRGSEIQEIFSSETEELAVQSQRALRAAIELALGPKVHLAVTATDTSLDLDEGRQVLARLDRDEERQSVRLSYRPRTTWGVALGYETGSDLFEDPGAGTGEPGESRDLSNDLEAVLLQLDVTGNRIGAFVEVADRSLEPTAGSSLAPTDVTTYRAGLFLEASRRVGLGFEWQRDLTYAVADVADFYLAERYRLRSQTHFGPARLALEVAVGSDDFRTGDGPALRSDDVLTYGGDLGLQVREVLRLVVGVRHTTYDSALDAFDRDVTVVSSGLELGTIPDWLRPRSGSDW